MCLHDDDGYVTREVDVPLHEVIHADGLEAFLDILEERFGLTDYPRDPGILSDITYRLQGVPEGETLRFSVRAFVEPFEEPL